MVTNDKTSLGRLRHLLGLVQAPKFANQTS